MISFTRYINITSGVAGGAAVATRDLIARIFSTNPLIPTGTIIEFESASDVSDYFGSDSEEYERSAQYFGWVSKSITAPKKIAFAHWTDVASAPLCYGVPASYLLASFTAITTGAIKITLGAVTETFTAIDFTGDLSLADVAATMQTKIRTGTGGMFTSATVTYDAVRQSFQLVGGSTGNNAIVIELAGSGVELLNIIGWGASAILSDGQAIQPITTVLADSTELNNNFGSFCFTTAAALSNDEIVEAATWNNTENVMFQYHVPVTAANAATLSPLVIGYAGIGLTLDPEVDGEYPEMAPMTVLAATNYNRANSAKNYMYQQFPTLTASVTENADANTYDGLRINYIGLTQTAGQQIEFYQRGNLMGGSTAPTAMGVYGNEQWFKDAVAAILMSLQLSVDQLPANATGESWALGVIQSVIDQALFNSTISVGKTFNAVQKLAIGNITDDPNAWQQVSAIGYWVDASIEQVVVDDLTEYHLNYTVVYGKGDSVNKINGTHVLI